MKRYLIFVVAVALIAGASTFYYYQQQPAIPEKVQISFSETFPSEKYPKWKQKGDFYKAAFTISGRERTSLFNAEGKLLSYTEEIEKRHIPAAVLIALQEQFPGFEIDDVFRFYKNGTVSYLIELENDERPLKLQVDSNGKLLSQQHSAAHATASIWQTSSESTSSGASWSPAISLGKPLTSWELPSELREVSGISMLPSGKMACVQDEAGTIFIYDLDQKAVTGKIPFAGSGDYEGLEVIGKTVYVLRSDGVLFEIPDYTAAKPAVAIHESKSMKMQDAEGLAYDKTSNRLLIASKGSDRNLTNAKGLYAFSLADKTYQNAPAITIPLQQQELASSSKKRKKQQELLQPSSLTVHPLTGELYLLDAKNYQLVVINAQGLVQKKVTFSKDQFRQAEGICFDSNGEMYISSEGKKTGVAVLVKFSKGI